MEQEDEKKVESSRSVRLRGQIDGEYLESLESPTTNVSDVIIPQPGKPVKEGCRLKIEILSLLFEPSSSVALDQSVQQVYVEYCLLGIPRETTETPMSLKKPTQGEEIHFNFCRVIHIDYMKAATVGHYLYTKLERTDAEQGSGSSVPLVVHWDGQRVIGMATSSTVPQINCEAPRSDLARGH
ncbi:X-linked retinitis pigmentosa GTPase regulator-interacting protein 1 [Bagarius yarrelli]|uniref:X-linked retinitis pigmentosa GTPase regulator-interacting protein 1 n=1 Tax=Bagarius yarrelli TaxID=175774 RepID=A0A556TM72_BAGYA|nr:X-linked retinitis pigmentosa GTPase regulator-interacting protein 1 [Bagarius yarrelli]